MNALYAQTGTGTNRQTFNKQFAAAEKSPIFQKYKSYTKLPASLKKLLYEKHVLNNHTAQEVSRPPQIKSFSEMGSFLLCVISTFPKYKSFGKVGFILWPLHFLL